MGIRNWARSLFGLGFVAILVGCGTPQFASVTPAMTEDFKNGTAVLTGDFSPGLYFMNHRGELEALYETHNWQKLADAVMQIGLRMDVTYFYLGSAAEGLGYYPAAERYYRYAFALSRSTDDVAKCASNPPLCGILNFPGDINTRFQAVELAAARQQLPAQSPSGMPATAQSNPPNNAYAAGTSTAPPARSPAKLPKPVPVSAPAVTPATQSLDDLPLDDPPPARR